MNLLIAVTLLAVGTGVGTLAFRRFLRRRFASLLDTLLATEEQPVSAERGDDVRDDPETSPSHTQRSAAIEHDGPVEVSTLSDVEPRYLCPAGLASCRVCLDEIADRLVYDRIKYSVGPIGKAEADYMRRFARADARKMLTTKVRR